MSSGYELAKAYEQGVINGWLGKDNPELVREQFLLLSTQGLIRPFFKVYGQTMATEGRKMMLYNVVRKVLGSDIVNIPQETGDCVSWGAKHGTEYVNCVQILNGERQKFRLVFSPYYYGTGRVYVGQNRLGRGDGSLGSWMAEAVQKYGTVFCDDDGVPQYSGAIAKHWGDSNSRDDLDKYVNKAKEYCVKSASLIRSWDELVKAVINGYPCPTASDIGYNMEASSDGFHRQTTTWGHQMCIIGVDDNDKDPYGIILNSWGDVHGHLKDFDNGEDLPVGVLRVRRKDIEKHLRAGETFAYSQYDAPKEQDLDKALFRLV